MCNCNKPYLIKVSYIRRMKRNLRTDERDKVALTNLRS